MNTEPLRNYIKGVEAYKAGNKEGALKLIASSMGTDKPTGIMEDALDSLVDAHDVALTLILHESQKEA